MNWFERLNPMKIRTETNSKKVPEGLWTKCDECSAVLYQQELERSLHVCPKCGHHMRINARQRLLAFLDEGTSIEIGADIEPVDFLNFRDSKKYKDRLLAAQKSTGEKDAFIALEGTLKAIPIATGAMDFNFMGGSMGSVMGERFIQLANLAMDKKMPLVVFSASGGARMQEALVSLMQMAKTSAAIGKMRELGLPFISVLTDPTMGGVSASLAMLGDINIAEPKALIGFAGPRVIEQTVWEKLPEGFQRSEFLVEKGALDMIVDRREMRNQIASILSKLMNLTETPDEIMKS